MKKENYKVFKRTRGDKSEGRNGTSIEREGRPENEYQPLGRQGSMRDCPQPLRRERFMRDCPQPRNPAYLHPLG